MTLALRGINRFQQFGVDRSHPLARELRSGWLFREGGGAIARPLDGLYRGQAATNSSGASWSPGSASGTRSLTTASPHSHISLSESGGGDATLDDLPVLSAACRIKASNFAPGAFSGRIIDKRTGSSTVAAVGWGWSISAAGNLTFFANFSTGIMLSVVSSGLSTNTWYNLAVTWLGTGTATGVKFYVNGRQQQTYSTATDQAGSRDSDASTVPSLLGMNVASPNDGPSYSSLEYLYVWGRLLTQAEIAAVAIDPYQMLQASRQPIRSRFAAAAFQSAWARNSNLIIGAGARSP